MKAAIRTLAPAADILVELFDGSKDRLARFLLRHTYFISPERIAQLARKEDSFACFPDCVRESREHHKGKRRKDVSIWNGREVKVCDNTTARLAFARFTKLVMAGDRESRIRGYHVAHIWERVYDPHCFTAGWNLCLMPGFLKLFTEQQDPIQELQVVIRQAAYDLYFRNETLGLTAPPFVSDPGLDLPSRFSDLILNLL